MGPWWIELLYQSIQKPNLPLDFRLYDPRNFTYPSSHFELGFLLQPKEYHIIVSVLYALEINGFRSYLWLSEFRNDKVQTCNVTYFIGHSDNHLVFVWKHWGCECYTATQTWALKSDTFSSCILTVWRCSCVFSSIDYITWNFLTMLLQLIFKEENNSKSRLWICLGNLITPIILLFLQKMLHQIQKSVKKELK